MVFKAGDVIIMNIFTQCSFMFLLMDRMNQLFFPCGGPKALFFFPFEGFTFFNVVNKLISSTYAFVIYGN